MPPPYATLARERESLCPAPSLRENPVNVEREKPLKSMSRRRPRRCLLRVLQAALLWLSAFAATADETWILVDTQAQTLDLMDDERPLLHIERIAIGRGGVARDRARGDARTPLGRFRVAWLNPNSRFRQFIGLDYPRWEQVERAYREGVIDARQRERFRRARFEGRPPPQDTPLGGHIGIHGLGAADPQLHDIANWTEGCVAVTNGQIDRLLPYVRIGMTVVIR